MPIQKKDLFKIANILLAVSFFTEILTVIGIVFLRDAALKLGIFHTLLEVHEYNGFIFTALIFVHIYFNWGWVRANILNR